MKKKELLKRIEALEKQLQPHPTAARFKEIADHANAINDVIQNAPKDETIYVPDGILERDMEIVNGKMILWHNEYGWDVHSSDKISLSKPNQFKLVPCKREDLKAGDVAFVYLNEYNNDIKYELINLENYMIVTEKGLVYWDCSSGGISVVDYELNSSHVWYKVVEA
jgi:hypothetical protein